MPLPRPKLFRKRREFKEKPGLVSRFCINLVSLLTSCFHSGETAENGVKATPKRSKSFISKIKRNTSKVGVVVDDGNQPGPSGYNKHKHSKLFSNNKPIPEEPRGTWTPVEKFHPDDFEPEPIVKHEDSIGKAKMDTSGKIPATADATGQAQQCNKDVTLPNDHTTEGSVSDEPKTPNSPDTKLMDAEETITDAACKAAEVVKIETSLRKEGDSKDKEPSIIKISDTYYETPEPEPTGADANATAPMSSMNENNEPTSESTSLPDDDYSGKVFSGVEKDDESARCVDKKEDSNGCHTALGKVPSQASGVRCKSPVARRSSATPKYIYLNDVQSVQSITISRPNSTLERISELDILKGADNDHVKHACQAIEARALLEDVDKLEQPSRRIHVMQVNDAANRTKVNEIDCVKNKPKSFSTLDRAKTSCLSQKVLSMRSITTVGSIIEEDEDGEAANDKELMCIQPSECQPLNAAQNVPCSQANVRKDGSTIGEIVDGEKDKDKDKEDDDGVEEEVFNDILSSLLRETVLDVIGGSGDNQEHDLNRLSKALSDEAIRHALEEEGEEIKNVPKEFGEENEATTGMKQASKLDRLSKTLSDEVIRQALDEECKQLNNMPTDFGDNGAATGIERATVVNECDVSSFKISPGKDALEGNGSLSAVSIDQERSGDGLDVGAGLGEDGMKQEQLNRLSKTLSDEVIRQALDEECKQLNNMPTDFGDNGAATGIERATVVKKCDVSSFKISPGKDALEGNGSLSAVSIDHIRSDNRLNEGAGLGEDANFDEDAGFEEDAGNIGGLLLNCWTEDAISVPFEVDTVAEPQTNCSISDVSENGDVEIDEVELQAVAEQLVQAALSNTISRLMGSQ